MALTLSKNMFIYLHNSVACKQGELQGFFATLTTLMKVHQCYNENALFPFSGKQLTILIIREMFTLFRNNDDIEYILGGVDTFNKIKNIVLWFIFYKKIFKGYALKHINEFSEFIGEHFDGDIEFYRSEGIGYDIPIQEVSLTERAFIAITLIFKILKNKGKDNQSQISGEIYHYFKTLIFIANKKICPDSNVKKMCKFNYTSFKWDTFYKKLCIKFSCFLSESISDIDISDNYSNFYINRQIEFAKNHFDDIEIS